jgi:hypothetical protein
MTNLFKISFRPGEEVSAPLEAIDRDPARIDLVITGAAPVTSALDTEKCLRRKLSGTSGSNPLSSSSQSVSAVNPEAIGEKPRTLAAVCGWLGT